MDESPNSGENEEPVGATVPNTVVRMKKGAAEGRLGEMAGDALMYTHIKSCCKDAFT
jgi:hypothetical protein